MRFQLLTTSGVPVKSYDGECYVTVSAHGFARTLSRSEPAEVWHLTKETGRSIGTITRVLGDTDIGLMTLEPGI